MMRRRAVRSNEDSKWIREEEEEEERKGRVEGKGDLKGSGVRVVKIDKKQARAWAWELGYNGKVRYQWRKQEKEGTGEARVGMSSVRRVRHDEDVN